MPDFETNPRAVEAVIEKLVYGGAGLARIDGRVALVPFVLPGERVRIEPQAGRRGVLSARLESVVEPSAARTHPPCPFFYRCGGCQYQHGIYEAQVEAKRAIVAETLARIGKLEPPGEIDAITGEPWGYRNRTQFHVERNRLGYFGFGTHALVPVDRCPISSPRINEVLTALNGMVRDRRWPAFVRSVEVFTNETDVQINVRETDRPVARRFFEWCAEAVPGFAPAAIEYRAASDTYRVGRNSFFQVNRFLTGRLVERALEGASGGTAFDLYAGAGLFSLQLARRFERVTAVEGGAAARDLEYNAERAGVRLEVRRSPVEAFLEGISEAPDFVLADPPRAGLGKSAVRSLLRLEPARLSIVSCDPATLARDLAALTAGGYRLARLTLIDLFPQTYHIETVSTLERA